MALYLRGFPLSYAQVYFSNNVWLGLVLMLVSFADGGVGLSGLISILVCQLCAVFFRFDRSSIFDGAYTYNALMAGLAMGGLYQFSSSYLLVLVIASMFTFFLTVWLMGRMAVSGLPVLSLPFLLTIWTVLLGLSNFSGFQLESKQAYSLQEWYPQAFSAITSFIDQSQMRDLLHLYLRSLSAIFFQYNDLAGLVIALALLAHSRMSFALTLYGFGIGYLFYHFLEGDFTPLIYSYIGFNFMLTAIALGGFFIVPSTKSHLLLLFVVPVTALLLSALHTVFAYFRLPLFSLPFNIVVVLMVGVLRMRYVSGGLQLVVLQQYSPEKNHYKSIQYHQRFGGQTWYHLSLPFIGEWYVSQGHEGNITHKKDWKEAWDFDLRNDEGKTYREPGYELKDYFCYEMPVTAPAHGWVVLVKDGVRDNEIKGLNLEENWGNTLVIKHAEGLYSKLSHLKAYSFKVSEGDYVRAGELVAACGNSGRSPEPHLHFQVQATPYIGSHTLKFPLAYYLVRNGEEYRFHSFDIPEEGAVVRNVVATPVLSRAFGLVAGKELNWNLEQNGRQWQEHWSVFVDASNRQYLYCSTTKAAAYFVNDGTMFYFTDFYGSRTSFLYSFYLACHRVLLGCYRGVMISDKLLPDTFFPLPVRYLHDFVAPFVHFLEGDYELAFDEVSDYASPSRILISTVARGQAFGRTVGARKNTILVDDGGLREVQVLKGKSSIKATCVS